MTMVKTLVALATERMLLKTSGPTFLRGIEFMYAAGLAPDRLSVMMTSSHKFVLQFHSKCDIRPFAANYPNFGRVLRGIVHVREWRIKSIEFVNVAFYMRDVDNLERAIEKLGVELVLLRNCTYPGVQRGDEAVKFLSALNRKKQAVVCEYGDDRLKHRIGRRISGHRTRRASRNGQEVIAPQDGGAPVVAAPGGPDGQAPNAQNGAPDAPPGEGAAQHNNNEAPAARIQQPVHIVHAPHYPPQGVRRPIPLNPEQARQLMPQMLQPQVVQQQGVPEQVQDAPAAAPVIQSAQQARRVVVGGHVYEFRHVDVPSAENLPTVQNLNHLLSVLGDNANNDMRVIVLPENRNNGRGEPAAAAAHNNNPQVYRNYERRRDQQDQHAQMGQPLGPVLMRYERAARMGQLYGQNYQVQYQPFDNHPAQLMDPPAMPQNIQFQQQQMWNAYPVANAHPVAAPRGLVVPVQVPMFGVAVNEPQLERNADDSDDSLFQEEEVYDADQQRNEALRDLVADPEAQPNFAPVEAQPVDLDMLEEEVEAF